MGTIKKGILMVRERDMRVEDLINELRAAAPAMPELRELLQKAADYIEKVSKAAGDYQASEDANNKIIQAFVWFEEFWKEYPRRPNNPKEPARQKYYKAIRDGADHKLIYAAIKNRTGINPGAEGAMIPMAQTWLNQKRWEEYQAPSLIKPSVFVEYKTPQWEAWMKDFEAKGLPKPSQVFSRRGGGYGRYFPSLFPPNLG